MLTGSKLLINRPNLSIAEYDILQEYLCHTVYPNKYAHGFCFAVLCCGYTLTDFPISIRLTSLALWQSDDCPSASKATLMNMDKYFIWIHYERLHNHNKAKHNKTVCIFLGIYCTFRIAVKLLASFNQQANSFIIITKRPRLWNMEVECTCLKKHNFTVVWTRLSKVANHAKDKCLFHGSKDNKMRTLKNSWRSSWSKLQHSR